MSPDDLLTTSAEVADLCRELAKAAEIGFDTEFVSEHTYRPELCLIQIATADRLVAIDTLSPRMDLRPLWEVLSQGGHQSIVHAAREEFGFCLDAIDRPLADLFDVQVAAGLVGNEYPAGYGNLVQKLLGVQLDKGETRTDWRRRPLSRQQLRYALDDVRHLLPLRDALAQRMASLDRESWMVEEMASRVEEWIAWRTGERYRSVSGAGGLHGRPLAILRELWLWREDRAVSRNMPPRRILRDDLLVELAKRQLDDPKQIARLRGLDKPGVAHLLPQLSECIRKGLDQPPEEYPKVPRANNPPQLTMLGQFLSAALTSKCQDSEVAASLVGNPTDVRDFIAWQLDHPARREKRPQPRLLNGWRAELVGDMLRDLLEGRVTIRITNPRGDQPLGFEPFDGFVDNSSGT